MSFSGMKFENGGLGMELQEVVDLGDGVRIEKHRCNADVPGGRQVDQVVMPDASAGSMKKVMDRIKADAARAEDVKWTERERLDATRPNEPMWSYVLTEASVPAANGSYIRKQDDTRNGCPVYSNSLGYTLSRERQPGENNTSSLGWIVGLGRDALYGVPTEELSVPLDGWQLLGEADAPAPYAAWRRVTSEAVDAKTAGNLHFKRKDWSHAKQEYSRGLLFDPVDAGVRAALLSNRSECHLKEAEFEEALDDALAALIERPKGDLLAKTEGRRARAARQLGRFSLAAEAHVNALAALRDCPKAPKSALEEHSEALREVRALERLEEARQKGNGGVDAQLVAVAGCFEALLSLEGNKEEALKHLEIMAPNLESLQRTSGSKLESAPTAVVQHYARASGLLLLLAETYVDLDLTQGPAVVRLGTLCRGEPSNLTKLAESTKAMAALQRALCVSSDMHCAVHLPALLLEIFENNKKGLVNFLAGPLLNDATERLQRFSLGTPKALNFKLETFRYTREDWAAAQHRCAKVVAVIAECKGAALTVSHVGEMLICKRREIASCASRVLRASVGNKKLQLGSSSRDLLRFAQEAVSGSGEEARFKVSNENKNAPLWAQRLRQTGAELELVYWHTDRLDKTVVADVSAALEVVANEASKEGFLDETLGKDNSLGFVIPLLHADPLLSAPALRMLSTCACNVPDLASALAELGACRPLLALDAPSSSNAVASRAVELLKNSAVARKDAALLLAACSKSEALQRQIAEDERRGLSSLCSLMEDNEHDCLCGAARALDYALAFNLDRSMLLEPRFFEHVLLPRWRETRETRKDAKPLSTVLRRLCGHQPYLEKLSFSMEKQGRLGLLQTLTHELKLEDVSNSKPRLEAQYADLATRWTTEAKRAQIKAEASHDTLRATQLATKLKAVLNGSVLELGRNAGCYTAALAKCGFKVTVADPCQAALDAMTAACDTVSAKLESITAHFDVVLLADASTDLEGEWERALAHIKRVIKPKFLLLIDDRDAAFVMADDAILGGWVQDDASLKFVALPNSRDLFIFTLPGGQPLLAAKPEKKEDLGDLHAGLLSLD